MTGFLALVLVLQAFIPSFAYALEEKPKDNKLITKKLESPDSNFITIGKLKGVGFSKDNPTASISVEEVEQKNNHKKEALGGLEIGDEIVPQALRSTKSPYIQGQQPADSEKPKYWANVQGTLTTVGIDGTTFDWNKVLGQGAKVKLLFTQTSGNVMTGVRFYLEVDKDGTYTWQGSDGKPTYLPLYDVDGNPYTYNVQIQRNFSENAQLIIQESNGTPKAKFRQEGDKQVATISFLDIEIQQVASTKFVSEWHTSLEESNRPQIEGYFKVDDETDNTFNFPKNNTARTILRASFLENFVEDEDNGPWAFISSELETTPKTVEVKTDTAGLTFAEADGVKTVKSGDHKFKYDFTYDVINGGKLTMTEVIPVTFDSNGGNFKNFTAPDTATSIVKEVDYEGTLTEKAENPTREGKTFKGWSLTKGGDIVTDADFANIKEAKTFYAIWENNDIKAKELTVAESFNNGTEYVNDFIPTLDILKGQVEIKDANGVYQKLKDGDSLQILDDSGNSIADDDLKDKLYDKLKEDDATEVSRNLTLRGKVNFADGTSQGIEIPIKVIKNIYEGTSTGGKPSYVPKNYVKVTVDPTDKATNSQKTYYYVNPAAKVVIPGSNPEGKDNNVFTKWTMKADTATGDGTEYKLVDKPRTQFKEASTITAQYDKEGKGIIKIAYVDENGNEISADYHKDGVDYPSKKEGKLNSEARDEEFPKPGPDFKGYIYSSRDDIKGKYYKDQSDPDNLDTVKYSYFKKVTTDTPSNTFAYFPVIFDANTGEFEAAPKDKKTVYVYFNGNDATVEKVTFKEVRDEFEKAYSNPTKDGFDFKEWQNAKTDGKKPADEYEIKFKGWNWDADPDNGYVPETFYANYSAKTMDFTAKKVWDLQGATVADDEYPTMNFTLYRKVEGSTYDPVKVDGAEVKEITKDNVTATWKDLLKTNSEGKEYTYFVKETFKDTDIKNDNWITGEMVTKTEGEVTTNSITNKLKTVPGQGKTPDDKKNFVGKLTVKKVLENEPVLAQPVAGTSGFRKVPAAPIKFKFKVTGPYGYNQEFELEAGKEKEIKDLAYGQYTVEEIESNNYTAKYVEGEYTKGTSTLSDKPANVEISKANGEKTVTVVNQNLEKPDPNFVTLEATKIWVNGPADDHKEVTINVSRKVDGGQEEAVKVEKPVELKVVRDASDNNKLYYTWTNLPKHDKNGNAYTYTVEEDKIIEPTAPATEKTVKFGDNTYVVTQEGNTITNTYKVPIADVTAKKVWSGGPETDHTQATLNLFRQVEGGQKEQVTGATLEAAEDAQNKGTFNYIWKDLPTTDDAGKKYTYTVEEANVTDGKVKVGDNTYVVTVDNDTNTVTNTFTADNTATFTVKKVWADDVSPVPTMNFTLYRKVKGSQDEPALVQGAEVKEITKDVTEATWTGLDKTDANGVTYEYSVKETFKDESSDVKNANWILGEMVSDANGNTITNKLKTVPGQGEDPKPEEHRMGKLTITKKIESKVTQPQQMQMRMAMFGAKAPAAPLAFTFKVTDPYGKVVQVDGQDTFTLKANETKVLDHLLYGDYTVEETDAKGLTSYYTVGSGSETKGSEAKVTLTKDGKEGTVTFTNKNVNSLTNPNVIKVEASKIWVNGPSTDHTAVDLKLSRQADGGQKEEVTDVTLDKSRDANDVNKFNYVWKDLPKINDKGEEYTYTVEEANVTDNKVTVNGNTYTVTQDGNTITNTYVVPQTEDLIATKQWIGVPDGTKTPAVKFQLQRTANGVTEDVGDAMALTNNQVNFGKQDKTDKAGNVYTFSVKEVNADGSLFNYPNFTSEVNGLTVTNTYHAPEVKYTVTYDKGADAATGTMAADTDVRGTYTVKAIGFTNDGYTFKGWKVGDTTQIVQPGDTINVTGDVTLTAQWEKTTTPPTPDPDNPNPDKPNPWDPDPKPWNPDYPKPWNPNYPDLPYIPRYPEIRYETIVQEKIVKVPVPIADNAYVKEVRYMQGFMGDFRPKDGLTRAEAAQILANALVEDGYKYNPNFKLPYKDIGEAWYTRAVKIVTEARVFAGYDDGNFKPQDKITRNEWIATLKRFQELGDVSGNHMKLKDGHWAMAEIEAAYKEGWLKIYSDGLATYEGDKFIPREEVAAVSNKAFNRVLDKTYIINNDKNLITYKDVKKDMWSYEDILCASNTFLYKKDLYRAHWIKEDNNQFNINTDGFEIVKAKFQRNPR